MTLPKYSYGQLGYAIALLAIFLVTFAAHYTYLPMLGLYEDDYWAIGPNLGRPISDLWPMLQHHFQAWPTGRPLNHFLPIALTSVGSALGGLQGVYVLSYLWLCLNCVLVWKIARHLLSPRAALVATLCYALFPADSTRILLVHAAHVQGAMTFMLLGACLWLRNGPARYFAYPVAALSLLSYETAFLPFALLPLVAVGPRKIVVRTWVVHILLCMAIVGTVAAMRFHTGDQRVFEATASTSQTIYRAFTSLWIGPATSASRFILAAVEGYRNLDIMLFIIWPLAGLIGGIAWYVSSSIRQPDTEKQEIWPAWLRSRNQEEGLPTWWIAVFGAAAWSFSYFLTLTNYPPNQTVGRLTSTHVAAAFGASIAVAALAQLIFASRQRISRLFTALLCVCFLGIISYQLQIQRGYVFSWEQQRKFWHQVVEKSPEVGPGWTVIVQGPPAPESPVIGTNSWADLNVFAQIFGNIFANDAPLFAHFGVVNPATLELHRDSEGFLWRPKFWGGPVVRLDPNRLVLFRSDGQSLTRVSALDTPAGAIISSAPIPSELRHKWPDTPTARILFPEEFLP